MKKQILIYTLSDNYGIRYVGKTNNLKLRKLAHINESKSNRYNNHRINWIKSLLLKNELNQSVSVMNPYLIEISQSYQ